MIHSTGNHGHHIVEDTDIFPFFCIETPGLIKSALKFVPDIRDHGPQPPREAAMNYMLMIEIFEEMRIAEGVISLQNVIMGGLDGKDVIGLVD
jgi:hypothetical protein